MRDYMEEQQERELKNIELMSAFQKEVVKAVKAIGYKYKYNKCYELNSESMQVDIDDIKNMETLIKVCYRNGAQEKVWEIKKVLQVQ